MWITKTVEQFNSWVAKDGRAFDTMKRHHEAKVQVHYQPYRHQPVPLLEQRI